MTRTVPPGHIVQYKHNRLFRVEGERLVPQSKGGMTVAYLYAEDGSQVAVGVALCNQKDNFNRRIGRDIALGRALKKLEKVS